MSDPLVTLCTVAGRLEADRIQSWLAAEGIPAMVSQESAEAAYSLTVGAFGLADILVPASRADEAKALLAAMRSGELEQIPVDDDVPPDDPPAS